MKVTGGGSGRVLEKDITVEEALRYALSLPVCTANIGIATMQLKFRVGAKNT